MNKPLLKVGITGGIGSGKTTICKIFEEYGIPVYYADEASKILIQEDRTLIEKIKEAFGNDLYDKDNVLNKKLLAGRAFSDKNATNKLNAIVHPAVGKDFDRWYNKQSTPNVSYVLKEAALLFESDSYKSLDKVITVLASEEIRIARVIKRDQANEQDVRARMDKQMSDDEKVKRSDFVINNDGSQSLIYQVNEIHKKLCAFSEIM